MSAPFSQEKSMNWITGGSVYQKIVFLRKILERYTANGKCVVTNLSDINDSGFDAARIRALKRIKEYDLISGIEITDNGLRVKTDEPNAKFTQEFLNVLTLLCRKGDYLVLDEPDYGLIGAEVNHLEWILRELIPTYKGGVISTTCQKLYSIEPQNFYWCENNKLRKISESELWDSIPQFLMDMEDNMAEPTNIDKMIAKCRALGKNTFEYKNGKYFICKNDVLLMEVLVEEGEFTIPEFVTGIYRECEEWLHASPFKKCKSIKVINHSSITNMSMMFYYCLHLSFLDLSDFSTSRVTNMSRMFAGCDSLEEINLSGVTIPPGTNKAGMVEGCRSLKRVIT